MAVLGLYLLAKCQKCEKKYTIPVKKLKRKRMLFPCTNCSALVRINRPDVLDTPVSDPPEGVPTAIDSKKAPGRPWRESFRVRIKAYLPFFVISLLVFTALIYVADSHMRKLQSKTLSSSADVTEFIVKKMVVQVSEVMAKQASHYLLSHPYLHKEDFNTDVYLKKAVLQKIGVTGTTWLYEMGEDVNDWKIWVDYDPANIGRSMKEMEKILGQNFMQYWNIVTRIEPTKGASGISKWPDSEGILRDRFIAATPIEGTPFVIGASFIMDEVSIPFERIETEEVKALQRARLLLLSITVCGIIILLVIACMGPRPATVKD